MAKNLKELRDGSGKKTGGWEARSRSSKSAKTAATSALTQRPSKVSDTSKRVIKETSSTHHDALKRLADR